jgi:tetratricopeptide (TPR) repeat protein
MGFFDEYFRDPRYRNERILLVVATPVVLVLIGGLVYLLAVVDRREPEKANILTADRVQENVAAPADVSALQQGLDALSGGNHDAARELFLSVQGRERAVALRNLAFISRLEGRHEEAVGFLNESIQIEPSALSYFLRGDSQRSLGNLERARADIEEAAGRNPSEPVFSNALLLLRLEMGETEKVQETLQLRASLGLASTVPSWVLAAAALSLANNENEEAAILLRQSFSALPESDFDLLLTYRAIEQFNNNPVLLPYYIRTSTVRQR